MKWFYFFLIIFYSCNVKHKVNLNELSFISEMEISNDYLNKGVVSSPPNTWVKLIKFKKDGRTRCLLYRTPFADKQGVLKFAGVKDKKCDFDVDEKVVDDNIDDLKMILNIEKGSLQFNVLQIGYLKNDKLVSHAVPLINKTYDKKYQKYDNQLPNSMVEDVFIGEVDKVAYIDDGKLCHGVNIECKDVVRNNCDRCRNGFYEVVDFNCPQGGSKYCGVIECGDKNQPACPRGYQVLDSKLPSLCFEGSPAGFCRPQYRTFCNEKKILICI